MVTKEIIIAVSLTAPSSYSQVWFADHTYTFKDSVILARLLSCCVEKQKQDKKQHTEKLNSFP